MQSNAEMITMSSIFLKFIRFANAGCSVCTCSAAAAVPGGGRIAKHGRLHHVESGAVSVSLDGTEVALALGRSLNMDKTHQVGQGGDSMGVPGGKGRDLPGGGGRLG